MSAATMTFGDLNAVRSLAPRFRSFAVQLDAVATGDPGLLAIARAATVTSEEAAALVDDDLDLCRFLTRWQASGWSEISYERWSDAVPERYGVDEKRVRAAAHRAVETQDRLRQLGLTPAQALTVSASVGF